MRLFVESFKRLYSAGKVTEGKVTEMFRNGKITQEEFNYIIGGIQ